MTSPEKRRSSVFTERVCLSCYDENGSHGGRVFAIINDIQNLFVDKCPHCKNVVGEPEDISRACMALKCYHCPFEFCGFCYKFAR